MKKGKETRRKGDIKNGEKTWKCIFWLRHARRNIISRGKKMYIKGGGWSKYTRVIIVLIYAGNTEHTPLLGKIIANFQFILSLN